MSEKDKKIVNHFLNNKKQGLHLFLFGSKGSGKTSLSVAIATELSIKHHACVYTTAMKLYSMFFEPEITLVNNKNLWNWRSAAVLIIDDINPGDPIKEEIVSPQLFLKFLDTFSKNEVNREVLKNSNVIWVLGDRSNSKEADQWQEMLKGVGIKDEKIMAINLSGKPLDQY